METEALYQELCSARRQLRRGDHLTLDQKTSLLRRIAWLYRLFIASTREPTFHP